MADDSLAAKVTGLVAGSDDNQSGLMSELNSFLTSGGLATIAQRAESHGLIQEFNTWRDTKHPESTSAETIETLFTPDELKKFSHGTGQNTSGVVSALAMQLPRSVRLLAERE